MVGGGGGGGGVVIIILFLMGSGLVVSWFNIFFLLLCMGVLVVIKVLFEVLFLVMFVLVIFFVKVVFGDFDLGLFFWVKILGLVWGFDVIVGGIVFGVVLVWVNWFGFGIVVVVGGVILCFIFVVLFIIVVVGLVLFWNFGNN